MNTKLIYLHIPKTGGSSQRLSLYDHYRRENVFWFGIDDSQRPQTTFRLESLGDSAVVGGHKPLSFYPPELDALYLSVLREPIARTCSLFSHITRPLLRDNVKNRADKQALWLQRGMDPDSIVNSLANCREFRQQVANYQCRFLSRYNPDFDGTRRTLGETACVIGTAGNTEALKRYLADLLKWQDMPEKRLNQTSPDTLAHALGEPGAKAAIDEVVQEDSRLYNYVLESHAGLYVNIAEPGRFSNSLSSLQFPPAISTQELCLRNLSLYSKGYAAVGSDGQGSTSLIIANFSDIAIDSLAFPALNICYQVLDPQGRVLHSQPVSAPFTATIPAGGQLLADLKFNIPLSQLASAASLKVEIVINGIKSIAELNPLHCATVSLLLVP